MDTPYYFSLEQMDLIRSRWNMVNPETSKGQETQHDIEFLHSMAIDLNNL